MILSALSEKKRCLFQLKTMEFLSAMMLRVIEGRGEKKDYESLFKEHKKIKKLIKKVMNTDEANSERLAGLYYKTETNWEILKREFSSMSVGSTLELEGYDAAFENLRLLLQAAERKHVMLEGSDEEKQKIQEELSKKGKIFANTRANLHVLTSGSYAEKILLPDGEYVEGVELAFQTIQQQLKKANEEVEAWLEKSAQEISAKEVAQLRLSVFQKKQSEALDAELEAWLEWLERSAQEISAKEIAELRLRLFQKKQSEALTALEREAMSNLREKQNNLMGQMIAAKSLEEESLNKVQTMTFSPGVMVEFFNSATGRWKLEAKEKALKQGRAVSTSFWDRFKANTLKIFISRNGETEGKLSGYENKKGAGADNLEDQKRILEKVINLQAKLVRDQLKDKEGGLKRFTLFVNCPEALKAFAMICTARQGFGKLKSYQQYDIEQKVQDIFHESGTLLDKKYEGQVSHFTEKEYQSINGEDLKDGVVEKHYESRHAADARDIYGMRENDVVDLGLESVSSVLELQGQCLKNPALFMGEEESAQKSLVKQASPQQIYAALAFETHDKVPGLELSRRRAIFAELSIGQQAAVLGCFIAKETKPFALEIKIPIQFEDPILVLKILEGITKERAYEIMLAMAHHDNIVLQSIVGAANQVALAHQFMRCLSQEKQDYILDHASERKQNLFDLLSSARVGPLSQYLRKNKLREAMGLDIDISGEMADKFNDDKTPILTRAEILDRVVMRYEAEDERSNRHIRAIYKKFYQLCESKPKEMIAIFNASAHPEKLLSYFLMQEEIAYHKHPKSWGRAQAMWTEEKKEERASAYMGRLLSSKDLSMQTRAVILSKWIALHQGAIESGIKARAIDESQALTHSTHELSERDPYAPIHFYIQDNRENLSSLSSLLALLPQKIHDLFSKWIVNEIAGRDANEITRVKEALEIKMSVKPQAVSVDGKKEYFDKEFSLLEEWAAAVKPDVNDIKNYLLRYEKIHSRKETKVLITKLFRLDLDPKRFVLVMLAAVRNGLIDEALLKFEEEIKKYLFSLDEVRERLGTLVVAIFKEMFSKNEEDAFLLRNVEKLMEIIVDNKKLWEINSVFVLLAQSKLSEKEWKIIFTAVVKKEGEVALNVFKERCKDTDPEILARWGVEIINHVSDEKARSVVEELISCVIRERNDGDFERFFNLFSAFILSMENKERMISLLSKVKKGEADFLFCLLSEPAFDQRNPKREEMLEQLPFWAAVILNREDVKETDLDIFKIILLDTVGKVAEEQREAFREALLKEIKPERLKILFTGLSGNFEKQEEVNDVGAELLICFRIVCQRAVKEGKKEMLEQLAGLALMILEKVPKEMQAETYQFIMQALEDTEGKIVFSVTQLFKLIKQVMDETKPDDLKYILAGKTNGAYVNQCVDNLLKGEKLEEVEAEIEKISQYSTFLSGVFSVFYNAIIKNKTEEDESLKNSILRGLTEIGDRLKEHYESRYLDFPSQIKFLNLLKEKVKNILPQQQEQVINEAPPQETLSMSAQQQGEASPAEAAGVGGSELESRRSSGSQNPLLLQEDDIAREEQGQVIVKPRTKKVFKAEVAGAGSLPESNQEVLGRRAGIIAEPEDESGSSSSSLPQRVLSGRSQSRPVPQEAEEGLSEEAQTPLSPRSRK